MDNQSLFLETFRRNLALIITIVTFIFSYAKQTNEITNLQEQVSELKAQQIDSDKGIHAIANDIIYIKTTLEYIKQRT